MPPELKNTNPLLTAFQYKKPLRHLRRDSGAEEFAGTTTTLDLVERIHDLSEGLRTELAPQFDQLENQLDKSVVQVREKVDQLDDLQQEVRSVVTAFTNQTASTKQEVDGNLDQLRSWLAQPRDVEDLRVRLQAAREKLQKDSQRLETLSHQIAFKLNERQKDERNELVRYRVLMSSILVGLVAIMWWMGVRLSSDLMRWGVVDLSY